MPRRSAQHCSPDCPGSLDLHRSAVNIPGTCRHNKEAVVKGTTLSNIARLHHPSFKKSFQVLLTFRLCQKQPRSVEECSPARLGR